ncbi:hypothetical protein QT06_C0001G0604 [archaeon GW2011_AR15]|nr:hypothetical protein QT06_C0001G0604 [archaeon GW2011_AR15]MBS3103915.1 hypothetical protein [Candidatus Woesearchaeota archaeon]
MRYNKEIFDKEVAYYKKALGKEKAKNIFVCGKINRDAFFSFAPFSRAASELKMDMHVSMGYKNKGYEVLFDVWKTYENLLAKKSGAAEKALREVFDKANIKGLEKFFEKPDLILKVGAKGFEGDLKLAYKTKWFRPFMAVKLKKTTDAVVENVFAIKKSEKFGIGFELIREKEFLAHPLQDYMDSYAIAYDMFLSSKFCRSISIKASTPRSGLRDVPEKVSELSTTLLGLELSKDIKLPVFKAYKKLSKALRLDRIKTNEASFFISGKGYHGKHLFGEMIGYPSPDLKTKWNSPGGIIYKFHWYPQAMVDPRPPRTRLAFTSTVPIDIFVDSTLVDYKKMRARNREIAAIMEKCEKIVVRSNIKNGCDFEVGLVKKDGTRRLIMDSDSDARYIIEPQILKIMKKKTGMMANIPGGEAFTTPTYVIGRIVGDVIINVDRSYRLDKDNLFIVEAEKNGYKLISAPKIVGDAFRKRKRDAWKTILEQEKNKSLDKEIIELKKRNFNHVGEFAINTSPSARLCDYLIVNEKIANMIHVAFGSGFEVDAATEYHMDVVIDSPRQKLDIYGVDKKKNRHWIIKSGAFVL